MGTIKKSILLCLAAAMISCLVSCGNNSTNNTDSKNIVELETKISELEEEISILKSKNEELEKENEVLKSTQEEKEKESTIQPGDVTVLLTGKSTSTDRLNRMFADFEFSVTNNTSKEIQGIQGVAIFKDLFDVEIIRMNCDFTGKTIQSNETIVIDDLSLDCNRFMDDHLKLYNTDFKDLHFTYNVSTIVFTDGTSKSGN